MPEPVLYAVEPAQGAQDDGARFVGEVWRYRSVLGWLLAGAVAAGGTWYAWAGKVSSLEAHASATDAALRESRQVSTTEVRDLRQYVDTRLQETDRASREHEKSIAVINTRLDTLEKGVQETRDNTRILLDIFGELRGARRGSPPPAR